MDIMNILKMVQLQVSLAAFMLALYEFWDQDIIGGVICWLLSSILYIIYIETCKVDS